jgi:hypothetical protein
LIWSGSSLKQSTRTVFFTLDPIAKRNKNAALDCSPTLNSEINELASAQTASDFSEFEKTGASCHSLRRVELKIMMIEFIVYQGVFVSN